MLEVVRAWTAVLEALGNHGRALTKLRNVIRTLYGNNSTEAERNILYDVNQPFNRYKLDDDHKFKGWFHIPDESKLQKRLRVGLSKFTCWCLAV